MGKMSRTKGHSFERVVAAAFRPLWANARRGLQYRDGEEAPDVVGAGALHIECKRWVKCDIKKAYEQALSDSDKTGLIPVVVTKDDHAKAMLTMSLEHFIELLLEERINASRR